ncbi:GDSL esterase/lipase LIP-4-like isoform X2 [Nicotiana tomentosiformis]|uniref:GDSL esterase/lipase LIP-4-like isoform X2 n=1 Tax=Nicotiana tomentosiformis TaxID=4098 RepID=UPI00051C3CEA|nr:GDSL esterase/lipase LIP-4-like isoform X2 [Nicotiana tomentosiformis]
MCNILSYKRTEQVYMKMKTSSRTNSTFVLFACFSMLCISQLANVVVCECSKNMVIFNFGDSNSDTGGYAAAHGIRFGFPDGRTFFHDQPSDRLCDGRIILDFLCESLNMSYLSPYLESVKPNFNNGVNFAIGGATTLPKNALFTLSTQVLQFIRFKARYLQLQSKGLKDLAEEDFKNAIYMIDIGQNDIANAFSYLSQASQVLEKIPSFISEIQAAIWGIYNNSGKNFWVHNTGPLGCLPQKLATRNGSNLNDYGCIKSMNEAADAFNNQLRALCEQLRLQMKDATIVYVNIYAIKYDLIANSSAYGWVSNLEHENIIGPSFKWIGLGIYPLTDQNGDSPT